MTDKPGDAAAREWEALIEFLLVWAAPPGLGHNPIEWADMVLRLRQERDLHEVRANHADDILDTLREVLGACAETGVTVIDQARDLVAERDRLHATIAAVDHDHAVCLCGCPDSEHESYDEDGESCGHDTHECLRVCHAARDAFVALRAKLAAAQEQLARIIEAWDDWGGSDRQAAYDTMSDAIDDAAGATASERYARREAARAAK